jgi:hypothetical protein
MRSFKKFYEEMTGTAAVAGAGDDSDTVIVRKKYDRKKKRKDAKQVLKRFMEKWTDKYKKSIDCDNPKGFSQKAHCAGRDK